MVKATILALAEAVSETGWVHPINCRIRANDLLITTSAPRGQISNAICSYGRIAPSPDWETGDAEKT
jgi:hypothetical protein